MKRPLNLTVVIGAAALIMLIVLLLRWSGTPERAPVGKPMNPEPQVTEATHTPAHSRITTSAPRLPERPLPLQVIETPAAPSKAEPKKVESPVPFPPHTRAGQTPTGFKDSLAQALEHCGYAYSLTAEDCTEYPCIAWGIWDASNGKRVDFSECPTWEDEFGKKTAIWARPIPDGGTLLGIAAIPGDADDRDLMLTHLNARGQGMFDAEEDETDAGTR